MIFRIYFQSTLQKYRDNWLSTPIGVHKPRHFFHIFIVYNGYKYHHFEIDLELNLQLLDCHNRELDMIYVYGFSFQVMREETHICATCVAKILGLQDYLTKFNNVKIHI